MLASRLTGGNKAFAENRWDRFAKNTIASYRGARFFFPLQIDFFWLQPATGYKCIFAYICIRKLLMRDVNSTMENSQIAFTFYLIAVGLMEFPWSSGKQWKTKDWRCWHGLRFFIASLSVLTQGKCLERRKVRQVLENDGCLPFLLSFCTTVRL